MFSRLRLLPRFRKPAPRSADGPSVEAPKGNTLCALPFMHLNVMPNGTVHPCCASPVEICDDAGKPLNIRTHSFADIWASTGLREIRAAMLRGEEPAHCAGCYATERTGFASSRTNYNAMILASAERADEFTGYTRLDAASLQERMEWPTFFDLRFDNICNLQCVMCFASESSSIEADPVQTAWTNEHKIERVPNRFNNSRKWVASDELFEDLKQIGRHAEYVRLAGGEPFRSALALRWLAYLGETGKAKDITLQVYTNFHKFDERIVRLIAPFRFISLILSIDGVGDTYEYIRYPGKWAVIEQNVALLKAEQKDRLAHVGVSINATMSIPGAMNIPDLFDWGGEYGFGVTLSNAVDPAYVSIRYLPERTKDRLEQLLRDYAASHPTMVYLPSQIEQWVNDMRSVRSTDPQHGEAVANVMRFLNDMDASRGLNFRTLRPDVVEDYIDQTGGWNDEHPFTRDRDAAPPPPIGAVAGAALTIGDQDYRIARHVGGSVESFHEVPGGYELAGWAANIRAKAAMNAVAVAIGDDVVSTVVPGTIREDIAGWLGTKAQLAGFKVKIPRYGNRPTTEEPIRLYGLTTDGVAAPLAADFAPTMPIDKVRFVSP